MKIIENDAEIIDCSTKLVIPGLVNSHHHLFQTLTRNIPAFSRFLEVAALTNGQMLNYTNIARECGITSPTVKEYFQILDLLHSTYYQQMQAASPQSLCDSTPRTKDHLFQSPILQEYLRQFKNVIYLDFENLSLKSSIIFFFRSFVIDINVKLLK